MKTWNTLLLAVCAAWAAPSGNGAEAAPESEAAPLLEREQVLGNWFGTRPILSDHGLEIFGGYTVEVWGNTTGGVKTGSVYTGLLDFGAKVDLEKAVGWRGASLSTTWLWLSGRDASADLVGNFLTISNIAGFNTLRMFELWFQQNLLDDKISIRLGQLSADSEFWISDYSGLFINGTFGWPVAASMNIPNGGPAYPMGALGVRVALNPVDWLTFQSAVYQGNVFAQDVNRHGFRWRLDAQTGYTFLNEAQFRWNHREDETGLPGQLKPGVWFQTGQSADPLAESTGSGNSGFYLLLDQLLYREPAGPSVSGSGKEVVADGKGTKSKARLEKSHHVLISHGKSRSLISAGNRHRSSRRLPGRSQILQRDGQLRVRDDRGTRPPGQGEDRLTSSLLASRVSEIEALSRLPSPLLETATGTASPAGPAGSHLAELSAAPDLVAALKSWQLALEANYPNLLTENDVASRERMLLKLLRLIPVEYQSGVRNGEIVIPIEYRETVTFTIQVRRTLAEVLPVWRASKSAAMERSGTRLSKQLELGLSQILLGRMERPPSSGFRSLRQDRPPPLSRIRRMSG